MSVSADIKNLYTVDFHGNRNYNFDQLNEDHCSVIAQEAKEQAPTERYKAVAVGVASAFATVGIFVAATAVANLVAPVLFTAILAMDAITTWQGFIFALSFTDLLVTGSAWVGAAMATKALWNESCDKMSAYMGRADQLMNQRTDALLTRATLLNQAAE